MKIYHIFRGALLIYLCTALLPLNKVIASPAEKLAQVKEGISDEQGEPSTNASEDNQDKAGGLGETELNDLRAPKSPAFKLLGVAESDITLATSPKAFAINLLESISDSEGDFPGNISVEFAPFQWFDTGNLTLEEYYDRTGFGESIFQTLSISIASTDTNITEDEEELDATSIGIGLRFNLISGQPHPTIAKLIKATKIGDPQKSAEVLEDLDLGIELELCPTPQVLTPEADAEFKKCVEETKKEQYVTLGKALGMLNEQRVGFQLEFASAVAFDFIDDDFNDSELSKAGVWLTPSYVQKEGEFSFLGIGRYEYDGTGDKDDNVFDLGGRIIWQPEKSSVSLSAEYLRRFGDQEDDRIVGVVEYDINETYSVFASYGKTFEESFNGNDDLVALFGINIGLGKAPVVPIINQSN